MHKASGLDAGVLGASGGAGLVLAAGDEVLQAAGIAADLALGGPVVAVIWRFCAIGQRIFGEISLFKNGNLLLKESSIRENLNKIIADTVKYHDDKEYERFLGWGSLFV
jgi:hypothetical protein